MSRRVLLIAAVTCFLIAIFAIVGIISEVNKCYAASWGQCVSTYRDSYGTPYFRNRCNKTIEVKYCFTSGGIPMFTCPRSGQTTIRAGGSAQVAGLRSQNSPYQVKFYVCPYLDYLHGRCKFPKYIR